MNEVQLELELEVNGKVLPPAQVPPSTPIRLAKLRKAVFVFENAEADERYFKQAIAKFLTDDTIKESFRQYLYVAVWERNEQGKFAKYTFFNERSQTVHLDRTFFKWAQVIIGILNIELAKLESVKEIDALAIKPASENKE
jgi:hypothetical protein